VADTGVFWSPSTGRSWSYLWSLGPTPFGPLSTSTTLSFTQRDAMVRNMALATLNASVAHVTLLLEGVVGAAGPDVPVRTVLNPDQVAPYNQRISMFLFKLPAALSALGRLDHTSALGYALSMSHDAAALHVVMHMSRQNLAAELQCLGAQQHTRWWLLPGAAGVLCLGLMVWRRGGEGLRAEEGRKSLVLTRLFALPSPSSLNHHARVCYTAES